MWDKEAEKLITLEDPKVDTMFTLYWKRKISGEVRGRGDLENGRIWKFGGEILCPLEVLEELRRTGDLEEAADAGRSQGEGQGKGRRRKDGLPRDEKLVAKQRGSNSESVTSEPRRDMEAATAIQLSRHCVSRFTSYLIVIIVFDK